VQLPILNKVKYELKIETIEFICLASGNYVHENKAPIKDKYE